jgi:hypothetical protein
MNHSDKTVGIVTIALSALITTSQAMHMADSQTKAQIGGGDDTIEVIMHNPGPSQQEGVTLQEGAHNFVYCDDAHGNVDITQDNILYETVRFWIYEFTGDEPPFDGDFFISQAELDVNPELRSIDRLQHFVQQRQYYIMTDRDLYFSCEAGIESQTLVFVAQEPIPDLFLEVEFPSGPIPILKIMIHPDRDMELDQINFIEELYEEDPQHNNDDHNRFYGGIAENYYVWTDIHGSMFPINDYSPGSSTNHLSELDFGDHGPITIPANRSSIIQIRAENFKIEEDPYYFSVHLPYLASEDEPGSSYDGLILDIRDPITRLEPNGWRVNDDNCYALDEFREDEANDNDIRCNSVYQPRDRQIGVRLPVVTAICGNNILENGEECDGVEGCRNDCTAMPGFSCNDNGVCSPLIPTLPGGDEFERCDSGICNRQIHNGSCIKMHLDCQASGGGMTGGQSTGESCGNENCRGQCLLCPPIGGSSSSSSLGGSQSSGSSGDFHAECSRARCINVPGVGNNTCDEDSDCPDLCVQCGTTCVRDSSITGPCNNPSNFTITCDEDTHTGECFSAGGGTGGSMPNEDEVVLHSAHLENGNLIITYDKNFDTCAHVYTHAGKVPPAVNFICGEGNNLTAETELGRFAGAFHAGDEIKICHGNHGLNTCSEFVAITGEDQVILHSATIEGSDIILEYTKYFQTCAHIRTPSGFFDQRINFVCSEGEDLTARADMNDFGESLDVGDEIKLCHGNNSGNCSDLVTITGDQSSNLERNLFITITNASPDSNGTAVPTGLTDIGQFKFSSSPIDGSMDVSLNGIVFNVNATAVAIAADSFSIYNKNNPTKIHPCITKYLSGDVFTSANISGTFYVECSGIKASVVDSMVAEGSAPSFVLQANVVSPNLSGGRGFTSLLQIGVQGFANISDPFGTAGSHLQWVDSAGSSTFDAITYPSTSVKSTSYNS